MSNPETEGNVKTEQNEQVSVTVTRLPHCQVKFDISVQPEAVKAAYVKALKNINKEVNIPGFRKGKAPVKVIEERFGQEIQKEWIHVVLNTAFNEAVQLTHIFPMREGETKRPVVHECTKENGASLTIEFETRPQIPTIDFEKLQIRKVEPMAVTQEMRDHAMKQVVRQFIQYEPVEDRGVQEGDYIDIDVEAVENPPRLVVDNRRVQVGETDLPKWMKEKVVGLKTGESAEGETEDNPEHPNPQFRPTPFRVTVKAIWSGETPEVNDELAKQVGLQSLDELHSKIEERLTREVEEDAYQQQMRELENVLTEQYPVEIPESILKQDKAARLTDYVNHLNTEEDKKFFQSHQSQLKEMIAKSSEHGLHLFFLLRKVAADYNIELNEEDIKEELGRQIALIPSGRSAVNILDKNENLQERLHTIALDRKIKQFLLDKATLI